MKEIRFRIKTPDGQLYVVIADIVHIGKDKVEAMTYSMMPILAKVNPEEAQRVLEELERGKVELVINAESVQFENESPDLFEKV